MAVTEMFFALPVADMRRATDFYSQAFGASVRFATPGWSSLVIAGVRLGLFPSPGHAGAFGLHFVVTDLAGARADVERAGGRVGAPPQAVAPGVVIAEVTDSEGNQVVLRQG
jgi:predicted enzyme related to lactoylglutathione lyase